MDTAAAAAQGDCKPFLTPPDYLGIVPTTTQVLGFEAGRQEMTTAQCYQYLDAVAAASDRVKVGVVGHSAAGREIRYAVIGRPEHVTNAGLEKVRQAHYEIADPSTPKSRVNTSPTRRRRSCGCAGTSTATRRAAQTPSSRSSTVSPIATTVS